LSKAQQPDFNLARLTKTVQNSAASGTGVKAESFISGSFLSPFSELQV
jgi:hypothetical protein